MGTADQAYTPALDGPVPQSVPGTAGPGEAVPVAFLGRTSTLLQDPIASMRRQVRRSQEWLPPGFQIVSWYWDVESGGLDLEQRSQGTDWQAAAGAGIPRDGGMADLLKRGQVPGAAVRVRGRRGH